MSQSTNEILETLVNESGVDAVLSALADVCIAKGNRLIKGGQVPDEARQWDWVGNWIERTRKKIERGTM